MFFNPLSASEIAGLAVTDGNFIVGDGANWVVESGATVRTSLGLGSADTPAFVGVTLSGDLKVPPTNKVYLDGGGHEHTYLTEVSNNKIRLFVGGTEAFTANGGMVAAKELTGAACLDATVATATVPGHGFVNDWDTGIGRAAADKLSLIAGGKEGIRLVEDAWGCSLHIPEITTPTAIANYGAVYTKSDNKLYFQDGAGTEHEIALV